MTASHFEPLRLDVFICQEGGRASALMSSKQELRLEGANVWELHAACSGLGDP